LEGGEGYKGKGEFFPFCKKKKLFRPRERKFSKKGRKKKEGQKRHRTRPARKLGKHPLEIEREKRYALTSRAGKGKGKTLKKKKMKKKKKKKEALPPRVRKKKGNFRMEKGGPLQRIGERQKRAFEAEKKVRWGLRKKKRKKTHWLVSQRKGGYPTFQTTKEGGKKLGLKKKKGKRKLSFQGKRSATDAKKRNPGGNSPRRGVGKKTAVGNKGERFRSLFGKKLPTAGKKPSPSQATGKKPGPGNRICLRQGREEGVVCLGGGKKGGATFAASPENQREDIFPKGTPPASKNTKKSNCTVRGKKRKGGLKKKKKKKKGKSVEVNFKGTKTPRHPPNPKGRENATKGAFRGYHLRKKKKKNGVPIIAWGKGKKKKPGSTPKKRGFLSPEREKGARKKKQKKKKRPKKRALPTTRANFSLDMQGKRGKKARGRGTEGKTSSPAGGGGGGNPRLGRKKMEGFFG